MADLTREEIERIRHGLPRGENIGLTNALKLCDMALRSLSQPGVRVPDDVWGDALAVSECQDVRGNLARFILSLVERGEPAGQQVNAGAIGAPINAGERQETSRGSVTEVSNTGIGDSPADSPAPFNAAGQDAVTSETVGSVFSPTLSQISVNNAGPSLVPAAPSADDVLPEAPALSHLSDVDAQQALMDYSDALRAHAERLQDAYEHCHLSYNSLVTECSDETKRADAADARVRDLERRCLNYQASRDYAIDSLASALNVDADKVRAVEYYARLACERVREQERELEAARKDAERFVWYFDWTQKGESFLAAYMLGMREHWNLDQWRVAIDAARSAEVKKKI